MEKQFAKLFKDVGDAIVEKTTIDKLFPDTQVGENWEMKHKIKNNLKIGIIFFENSLNCSDWLMWFRVAN